MCFNFVLKALLNKKKKKKTKAGWGWRWEEQEVETVTAELESGGNLLSRLKEFKHID